MRLFRFNIHLLTAAFVIPLMSFGLAAADPQDDEISDEQEAAEKAFAEKLTNSVMIGAFTVDGRDAPPKEERYEIKSLTKLTGKQWTFHARIKYGTTDVTVPITVPVEWAGNTPVVTIDDLSIPGMKGSFGARVLFHGDRYVGTWQHDAVGGHMFGRIEKARQTEEATKDE